MTVKLYENDAYIKEFEATVLSCDETDGGYCVVLDKTAFFPEGGGQQADTGYIGDAEVLDVQEKDSVITHKVDKALTVGETVSCKLDWDIRFARMQGHTGEHLVSGIIHSMYGYDNLGFHMSDKTMTLDPSGILTASDIKEIELRANKAIYENREVTAYYPETSTLDTLSYRSKLDLKEGVRLVNIDGYDLCACCAPHVHRTGEIGLIKIIDFIQYKGGMRLTMVCGINAFEDYSKLHDDNKEMMHTLSASRDKVLEFVLRDHELIGTQKAEINRLCAELSKANLDTTVINDTLVGFTVGASFDDMRALVNDSLDKADKVALFSQGENNDYSYIISSSSLDIRDIVKELNSSFAGKGGGRPNYAQGKITAEKEDVLKFFENL
ncbi:MAG: alanine--tRNA ligase-related protein [Eubacteriales bacterium]|nr:alanine--tRNA ligase-related protein [Eubacteriales bacterium]